MPEDHVATFAGWFEALVADGTPEASVAALRVFDRLADDESIPAHKYRDANVLLTSDGRMVAPISGTVFRSSGEHAVRSDVVLVHPAVQADPGALPILDRLKIGPVDPEGEFRAFLDDNEFVRLSDVDWAAFWTLTRGLHFYVANEVLFAYPEFRHGVRALAMSGEYSPLVDLLLPGPVVSRESSADAGAVSTWTTTRADLKLLSQLGATRSPTGRRIRMGGLVCRLPLLGSPGVRPIVHELTGHRPTPEYLDFDRRIPRPAISDALAGPAGSGSVDRSCPQL